MAAVDFPVAPVTLRAYMTCSHDKYKHLAKQRSEYSGPHATRRVTQRSQYFTYIKAKESNINVYPFLSVRLLSPWLSLPYLFLYDDPSKLPHYPYPPFILLPATLPPPSQKKTQD